MGLKTINIMIVGGNYIGKGAEAMMLVVKEQLLKIMPNAQLWAMPINSDEADKLYNDGFKIITQQSVNRLGKAIRLLFTFIKVKYPGKTSPGQSVVAAKNVFEYTDFVIDISGFLSSDQIGIKSARNRWITYRHATCSGNKILFLPQSWGPFNNRWVRLFTRWTLKKANLICAREKVSYEYLMSSNCVEKDKICFAYDIAFLFKIANPGREGRRLLSSTGFTNSNLPLISITPNMRIYERVEGVNGNNLYVRILMKIINYFLEHTQCNIVLIPHEASYSRRNDPELCVLLMEMTDCPERMAMLSGNESARQVKDVIGISDFLIASRYHSLVAAFSTHTPAAVIGWSHKYDELMKVFGLKEFLIDPVRKAESGKAVKMVVKAFEQRKMISEKIRNQVPGVERRVKVVFEKIADELSR